MNQDPDKIDLSALDPSRDAARWERMVRGVVARATAAPEPHPLLAGVVAWWRPALAVAALLAVAAWVPSLLSRASQGAVVRREDPASVLIEWAVADSIPANADVLELLGESHGR